MRIHSMLSRVVSIQDLRHLQRLMNIRNKKALIVQKRKSNDFFFIFFCFRQRCANIFSAVCGAERCFASIGLLFKHQLSADWFCSKRRLPDRIVCEPSVVVQRARQSGDRETRQFAASRQHCDDNRFADQFAIFGAQRQHASKHNTERNRTALFADVALFELESINWIGKTF